MKITYTLIDNPNCVKVVIEGDDRVYIIPNDLNNKDWREYQEWLALGNKPDPAPDEK